MTHKAKNIQQRRTCITAILIGALGSTVPQAELQAHKYYDRGARRRQQSSGTVLANHPKTRSPSSRRPNPSQQQRESAGTNSHDATRKARRATRSSI